MADALCYKTRGIIFFPKDKIPKKGNVLETLGVIPDTFAGNMFSRLYDYYFDGATDFAKEYKLYYSKEYDTLAEFIEEHYIIEPELAKKFAKGNYAMKECSIRSVERNIETLDYDEDIKNIFSDAVGGIEDEDPDGFYYK